ncbi:GFA family protein [Nitratireductor sp. ZSWI3]|uniref:GFA family protein n=1 Tax=Nitratireductor sp. ZSWI3 TaxID=2966359 RepID=UPI00214F6B4E|nr:GFA family protein [Nitratireductor sp. ZSWI3]MCR4266875.1 GFA family protein [Nitratireductor sp. ZSWI3]
MTETVLTGGCQCGAVRFRATRLGRPSICHCRMCQKQFGSFFGAFVTAYVDDLRWTRGVPDYFRSSDKVERGFCRGCGTPLTYRHPDGIELAIGAFDRPEDLEPQVQVNHALRLPWIDRLFDKPPFESEAMRSFHASIVSYQHPDYDTDRWPPRGQGDD